MPALIELTLHLEQQPKQALPYFLHAALHTIIERQDSVLGKAIHGNADPNPRPKPLALDWTVEGQEVRCLLKLLDESLAQPLLSCLESQMGEAFGHDHKNDRLGGQVGQARSKSVPLYTEIWSRADEAPAPKQIFLEFQTPMAVSGGGQAWPLPIPRYIWNGLLWRWNAYSPITFEENLRDWWDQVLICEHYQGKTRDVEGSRREIKEPGFVGRASYTFKDGATAHLRRQTAALAMFAELSGIGVNTAFGWGVVRVQIQTAN